MTDLQKTMGEPQRSEEPGWQKEARRYGWRPPEPPWQQEAQRNGWTPPPPPMYTLTPYRITC